MSAFNRRAPAPMTVNSTGTAVKSISARKQLTRLVLANLLFQDQFYVDGKTNAEQIRSLVAENDSTFVEHLAVAARGNYNLRHVPLFLMRELARNGRLKADALASVIQRADEMGDFMSLYWSEGKTPISNQVKRGLAKAFLKFNEYQLAKYDRANANIRIRDIMFLTHVKPRNEAEAILFGKVANQTLATPDTWETRLSAGEDKKEAFEDLMASKKLGALAFLRNLRNMVNAGIPDETIRAYGKQVNVDKVLPFRYIAAARIVPRFEDMLEEMMLRSLASHKKLPGRTVLVVDTSGSMHASISYKSDLNRIDAACALAILAREICEDVVIYATAGSDGARRHATMQIPPRRGFALSDYIKSSEVTRKIGGGGIFLVQAMDFIADAEKGNRVDRVMVFTDEQDTGGRGFEPHNAKRLAPKDRNYILNVGAYQNGINSGAWETVTGFSEATIDYIQALENSDSLYQ